MKQVTLKPFLHNGEECMGIYFENNASLNRIIRNKAGARWSGKGKCWYLPLSKENHNRLFLALEGRAKIEQSALYQYLVERKSPIAGKASSRSLQSAIPPLNQGNPPREIHAKAQWPAKQSAGFYESGRIYEVNAHILPAMEQQLKLKAYSPSTIRTYINEMMQLLKKLKNIPADSLLPEHLKRYFVYCYEELRLTENTLHSRINALKFYYEQVLFREKFFWEIPRPKKPLLLPRFFNQAEVASIIKAVGNLKHKVMLMLAYASGLRVSEVVSLKTRNIDSKRMCILIEQAKGKKDRMVALSPALLVMLREYWKKYKPSREGFLFSGQVKGQPYSTRSLQSVLQAAKQKAEVLKPGSIHALRHSFATHLLDKGTDVAMIMKLLGHNDIKTTLRYLHVTNRDLLQIISPLDSLDLD